MKLTNELREKKKKNITKVSVDFYRIFKVQFKSCYITQGHERDLWICVYDPQFI